LGTAIMPPTIFSGSFVKRCPSCQIQCVSIAVILPGAVANHVLPDGTISPTPFGGSQKYWGPV
jgi:hypothetical protein